MAIITIQCRLQAKEETLRYLWQLMSQQNALLVNNILEQIRTHPEMDLWLVSGYIPTKTFKNIVKEIKQQPKFQGMPSCFKTSAETLVKEIYKSWFAVQRKKRNLLWAKKRWLAMLKSEPELLEQTGLTLPQLQAEAEKILNRERKKFDKLKQEKKSAPETPKDLFNYLLQVYNKANKNHEKETKPHLKTQKLIQQCAVVYLLKNKCEIGTKPEDPEKYQQYRHKKVIHIQRLEEQLKARLPQGRNLATEEYLETLKQAESLITENEEMELLQARLLRSEKSIPFPVSYNTNTDIYWSKNKQGRIYVTFSGMKQDGHIFEVFCHNRQLHWFQRFYEDYHLYKQNKDQVPGGLLTLRSVRLVWQINQKKSDQPWLTNHLYLHCSVNTQLWTREATEELRQLKITQTKAKIQQWKEKAPLNKNQQRRFKSDQTSLKRLTSFRGFSRPSKLPSYHNSSRIMGVSIGLQQPVTVAVVDVMTSEIIDCRNTPQLLNKPIKQKPKKRKKAKKLTQYEFLLRRRQQQQENDIQRQQAQTRFGNNRFGESELGQYVDRLLTKAIVAMAIQYQVGSIVLPDLTNIREILESEITSRAEARIPGCKKAQKLYAKKYRTNLHRWSYARLCDGIKSKAIQKGLVIESSRQIPTGTSEIQARDLALIAYHHRQQT